MDNIISIILKDMNKLEEKLINIKKHIETIKRTLKITKIILTLSIILNILTITLIIRG